MLFRSFSYMGLAMATSISYMVTVVLMFFSLRKKVGSFNGKVVVTTFTKSLIASIIMSIVVVLSYNGLTSILGLSFIGEGISITASILLGALIYVVIIKLLKVEEMNLLESSVKNFFGKQ